MLGALGSTGLMSPCTLQYSPTAAGPAPAAGTTAVLVTTAPLVGSPMEAAVMDMPLSSSQVLACGGGTGSLSSSSPQPARASAAITAADSLSAIERLACMLLCLRAPVVEQVGMPLACGPTQ
jgi:hypothetical protein